jgi:hypothetical protein
MLGRDFSMVTSPADKNNGVVNFKWVDLFNDWVSRLGLIELELKKQEVHLDQQSREFSNGQD